MRDPIVVPKSTLGGFAQFEDIDGLPTIVAVGRVLTVQPCDPMSRWRGFSVIRLDGSGRCESITVRGEPSAIAAKLAGCREELK